VVATTLECRNLIHACDQPKHRGASAAVFIRPRAEHRTQELPSFYRAVDEHGQVIDVFLSKRRNLKACRVQYSIQPMTRNFEATLAHVVEPEWPM
jgi:hypothetical protein